MTGVTLVDPARHAVVSAGKGILLAALDSRDLFCAVTPALDARVN